jgi:hypothetical protein
MATSLKAFQKHMACTPSIVTEIFLSSQRGVIKRNSVTLGLAIKTILSLQD